MQPASILPELASGRGTSRRSRMVEGQTSHGFGHNISKHGIRIIEDLRRGNPNGLDASRSKPLVSCSIALGPVAPRVGLPVDFDRQSSIAAEEVEHVRAGRVLATELEIVWTLAKPVPQNHFR